MNCRSVAAAGAACLMLAGCASVIKGTHQSVSVSMPSTEGASCTLSNSRGSWSVTSPGTVTVSRSKSDMQIRCSKPGWQDGSASVQSGFEAWTLGNIILGGLVGVGIDWGTGAIQRYPDSVQVPMTKAGGGSSSLPNPNHGAGS